MLSPPKKVEWNPKSSKTTNQDRIWSKKIIGNLTGFGRQMASNAILMREISRLEANKKKVAS